MRTKEELKEIAFAAIDARKNDIIAFADSVYKEPEFGFKEYKTASKFEELLNKAGYSPRVGVALTGVIAEKKGKSTDRKVAVLGELDAIMVAGHKDADPQTGAIHACGHNCQISSVAAVAYALADTDIMQELAGDVVLMGTPAEEYIEINYRKKLRDERKIWFLSGKQEFVRLGEFDGIDAAIMQHTTPMNTGCLAGATSNCNGFTAKLVKYTGREAHAGAAPHEGVNALNAAMLGLMGIHANRETFKDEDHIRIHPIITKGGDIVNVVPADVRLETYVRGSNTPAILSASDKTNRALEAGADAVGAACEITELPGYLPVAQCEPLNDLMYENMKVLVGEDNTQKYCVGFGGGSTDMGDISALIPSIHSYFAGAEGGLHSEAYCLVNKENAILTAGKAMVATVIDLLYGNAEKLDEVKKGFKPVLTKEEYLRDWGKISE